MGDDGVVRVGTVWEFWDEQRELRWARVGECRRGAIGSADAGTGGCVQRGDDEQSGDAELWGSADGVGAIGGGSVGNAGDRMDASV